MAKSDEKLDREDAIKKLNNALRLQHRSVIEYPLVAASMTGFRYVGITPKLADFAREEVDDARRLAEKITSFEGEPTTVVAKPRWSPDPTETFEFLIEDETETIEALQASIEPTGREGRSEALEHRLEHMIMRKQEQVDFLLRAASNSSGVRSTPVQRPPASAAGIVALPVPHAMSSTVTPGWMSAWATTFLPTSRISFEISSKSPAAHVVRARSLNCSTEASIARP